MEYVRLGKSGLKVSKLILGCLSYGNKGWAEWVLEEEEALLHMKAAWDAGINTLDTSNAYSNGESERIIGVFLKKYDIKREEIVIMTKVCLPVGKTPNAPRLAPQNLDASGFVNQYGLSRKHIFESIKLSLDRMGIEYVDVLQCHRFDPQTPIAETMEALHDVVKAGYARYIGMSSCWAYQFQAMQNYALANRLTPFISMQNYHNAAYREEEREMMPTLEMLGVGCIPWSPLARGFLTRPAEDHSKTTRSTTDAVFKMFGYSEPTQCDVAVNVAVANVAAARGVSMAQIAVAYSLSKKFVTAPIVGSTKVENLLDLIEGMKLKLTEEEINLIEEPYLPRAVTGL